MAKLTVVGQAAVITSVVKAAVIKTLSKFKPEALKLKDDKDNTVFAVGTGCKGSLSQYGIVFAGENLAGEATLTLTVPECIKSEDKAAWVKDNFGYALLNLNTLETQINTAYQITAAEFTAMDSSITVE